MKTALRSLEAEPAECTNYFRLGSIRASPICQSVKLNIEQTGDRDASVPRQRGYVHFDATTVQSRPTLPAQRCALDEPLRDLLQSSLTPSFLAQDGLERIPYPSWGMVNQKSMLRKTSAVTLTFSTTWQAVFSHQGLRYAGNAFAVTALVLLSWPGIAFAQSSFEDARPRIVAPVRTSPDSPSFSPQLDPDSDEQSGPNGVSTSLDAGSLGSMTEAKQSKRILWIFPNYRAVSADTQLPPLSLRTKFWLATQDSFDYSSFVTAAMLAGISQAKKSSHEFGQGSKGYGRYYWHAMADQAVGNYLTEAMVPAVTHEDPRYYTLGHGGFLKRTGYAVSRLLVTRTDSGRRTINISEIVGNGAGAGISDLYYPSRERTWTKTGQKWVTQIALDGVFNIVKEFWPDVNHLIFHGK